MTFDHAAAQWHPEQMLLLEFGYIVWGLDHFKAKIKILHLKRLYIAPIMAA